MDEQYRLRVRDVPLQWHEAVVIVRDVADTLVDGDIRHVPAADALAVDPQGTVHLLESASSRQTPARDGSTQVTELRRLLGELLPTDGTPQQLIDLASAQAGSGISDPTEFSKALAFFERPSRQQDLQRLSARMSEAYERHRLEEELEQVTRKARTDPPATATHPHPKRPPKDKEERSSETRKGYLPVVLIGAAIGVVMVAAIALIGLSNAPNYLQAASPAQEVSPPSANSSAARSRRQGHPSAKERSAAAMPTPLPVAPRLAALLPELLTTAGQIEDVEVPVSRASASSLGIQRGEGMAPATSSVETRRSETSAYALDTVYDRSDEEVMPATLVRPRLPSASQPSALAKARSVLDVLVGPDGNVEQVRLVKTTPDRRYYDAMLLPAVKAWIFQPASRGGQPVRYRIRIPII